jgi:hypothetical protein
MTEAEWRDCTDPLKMLDYLEDKVSARTFRLYQCALLRQLWSSLDEYQRQAIELTERHFDTAEGSRQPAIKRRANKHSSEEAMGHFVEELVLIVFHHSPKCLPIFRCVFGNPFRAPLPSPPLSWSGTTPWWSVSPKLPTNSVTCRRVLWTTEC